VIVTAHLHPEATDTPRRFYRPDNGHHYIQWGTHGPAVLLGNLGDDKAVLAWLSATARECLLLAGEIERGRGKRP
jgi:hypothetical protein